MDDKQGTSEKRSRHERGVFEKKPGSGAWWVRYTDEVGRLHREKIGSKSLACKVYQKRKTEIQERRYFPERIRRHEVLVRDAIDECLTQMKGRLRSYSNCVHYAELWKTAFGGKTLRQLSPIDIEKQISARICSVSHATVNRELGF
jgi:hypothetical protein